MSQNRLEQ